MQSRENPSQVCPDVVVRQAGTFAASMRARLGGAATTSCETPTLTTVPPANLYLFLITWLSLLRRKHRPPSLWYPIPSSLPCFAPIPFPNPSASVAGGRLTRHSPSNGVVGVEGVICQPVSRVGIPTGVEARSRLHTGNNPSPDPVSVRYRSSSLAWSGTGHSLITVQSR